MWAVASLTQSRTCLPSRRSGCCEVCAEQQLLPRHLNAPCSAPPLSCLLLPAKPVAATLPAAPGSSQGLAHASWWERSSWLLSSGLLLPRCSGFLLAQRERLWLPRGTSGDAPAVQGYCSAGTPVEAVASALLMGLGKQCDALKQQHPHVHGPAAPRRPSMATSLCNTTTES